MKRAHLSFILFLLCLYAPLFCQMVDLGIKQHNDSLPALLISKNSQKIKNAREWTTIRRPEILELFETNMYGKVPDQAVQIDFTVTKKLDNILNGKAILKEVEIALSCKGDTAKLNLLILLPIKTTQPVPLFLGLNSGGNQTVHPNTHISITKSYVKNNPDLGITNNKATVQTRGTDAASWPIEEILSRGYGFATMYCGDMDPDFDDGFQNGIHPLFYSENQHKPKPNEWGTIAAWAFGLSKTMDYLMTDSDINNKQIAVIGHSRLAKAVLWAGARDERFAIVISNNSGSGGAALARRNKKETVKQINTRFPNWFCGNFKAFNDKENALPFDQHFLLALMAPRALYVAAAASDQYCDIDAEHKSFMQAGAVYKLFGTKTPQIILPFQTNQSIIFQNMGWHIRSGGHGLTYFDWLQYLNFAHKWFEK